MSNLGSLPWWIENPTPEIYLSDNYLVFDFETTNLDKGAAINPKNHVVSVAWKFQGELKNIYGNEYECGELLEDIERADFLIAHNVKFDAQWLARCGVDLTKIIIYDTQIGEYVLLGNRSGDLSLSATHRRYGGRGKRDIVARLMKLGICPSLMRKDWVLKYNRHDVEDTEMVFLKQRERLRDSGLLPTQYTRCIYTPVLADIEFNGLCLDGDRIIPIHRRLTEEYNNVLVEMDELTGGINPNSPKQMAEFVYDVLGFEELKRRGKPIRTPAGGRKTGADVLTQLKATTERQKKFVELKKRQAYLNAKLTKALNKLSAALDDPEDPGMIFAQFNQTVTQNHRLSSSGLKYKLQSQNFDREFKPLFKARKPGWKIGELDYGQLEWRTATYLSQDPAALEGIQRGEDVHGFTAAEMFREEIIAEVGRALEPGEIKAHAPFWRQEAKPDTFKPVYGGERGTEKQMRYYKAFREKYPTLNETQEGWTHEVLHTGKLVMPTGFIFYWPGTSMNFRGQISNKSKIYNYPVSWLAGAEIVPVGVTCLWHRMKSLGMESFLVNTIHDSGISEVAPGEEDLYAQVGEQAFIPDVLAYLKNCYDVEFNVPLEVEADINANWHDSKSWKDKWLTT